MKAGILFGTSELRTMDILIKQTKMPVGLCGLISLGPTVSAIGKGFYVIPFAHI
jgi:hypothetical protein